MSDDYYKILGIARTASADDIQKAYRKLARKHHPDLAEDKEHSKGQFQKIQNAYDVLSDPKKRELYDQLGPNFEQMGGRNPFQEYANAAGGTPFGNMEIDLGEIFGQGGGGGRRRGGFEEFLRQFGFAPRGPMPQGGRQQGPFPGGFHGQPGGFPGGQPGPFPGQPGGFPGGQPVRGRDVEETITIPFATAILGGKYQLSLQRGDGKVEDILITIPTGIEDGKRIRLRGQGQVSPTGGPRGDLLVQVKVASHPHFRRRGNDLHVDVPVTLPEAALGAKIDLPTPHGTVTLTIPPASSSGKTLRLKGLGVKPTNRPAGDLLAHIEITLPEEVSDEDRQALEKLSGRWSNLNPRQDLQW